MSIDEDTMAIYDLIDKGHEAAGTFKGHAFDGGPRPFGRLKFKISNLSPNVADAYKTHLHK